MIQGSENRRNEAAPGSSRGKSRGEKGQIGENAAVSFLEAEGWTVEARNWRCAAGEVDIVARKGEELAFVEVKTIDAYGIESSSRLVDARKRRHIVETSKFFLLRKREYNRMRLRYDVILVRDGSVERYIQRAFMEHP